MVLEMPIKSLPATSIVTIKRLKGLGIQTYWDLLNYFPFRYEDYSVVSSISTIQEGEKLTLKGKIISVKNEYTRKGLKLQRVLLSDGTGTITAVWYNQPFLIRLFTPGSYLSISGEIKKYGKLQIEPREFELLKTITQETIHTGRLLPIYPEKRGLSSRTIREKIFLILKILQKEKSISLEILPHAILKKNSLLDELSAYNHIHFPRNKIMSEKARGRLSFDELFIIQLSAHIVRSHWEGEKTGNILFVKQYQGQIRKFITHLPFILTRSQEKTLAEILADLEKTRPMNRFLQGDVGSGKTVVAAIASYISFLNGFQILFMAPTEILATQHYVTISSLFKNTPVAVGLQTSSKKIKEEAHIVIGTHALFTKKLTFKKVGLVIIDEQHRFGVRQRALLKKKGLNPHLLTMTATPIPRTVALALYGELDLSVLDEMPKGRIPVKTYLVSKNKRAEGYQWILKKVRDENIQVFIICPLIEISEVETMKSVKAATKEYEYLAKQVFPTLRVALIHGRLKGKEKDRVMSAFKNHEYDILVATSVVEVGIDIPNANIMIIEGADRYGLAQLHQLRGRVGRSDKQSYCLVFTESTQLQVLERLSYFAKNISGSKLAEFDLKQRGPGDLYGIKQHGFDALQIASLSDYLLIEKTKHAVGEFLKLSSVDQIPALKKRIDSYQLHQIAQD